jgi:hypothetical protein
MNRLRFPIATLMVLVAFTAASLAPLQNPTATWRGLLMYLKVGPLLYATFRARYGRGRAADWWFGFAAFGWACLGLNASQVWYLPPGSFARPRPDYFELFDVSGTNGVWLSRRWPAQPNPNWFVGYLSDVAGLWLLLATATLGGFLSLYLSALHFPKTDGCPRAIGLR